MGINSNDLFFSAVSPEMAMEKLQQAILDNLDQAIENAVDKAIEKRRVDKCGAK